MKLDIFRTLWGYSGDWMPVIDRLHSEGFEGIEARIPDPIADRQRNRTALRDSGTPYIAVVFTSKPVLPDQSASPEMHLADLERKLGIAAEFAPRFVNILAGNDRWPLSAQIDFFGRAIELAEQSGVVCCFETHRARLLGNPWQTLELIQHLPALRFTSDISHWVVSCERLLNDSADDLSAFVERVHHVQARVGYDQGPQVPHPAAPEYEEALAFHRCHWESVWSSQKARGYQATTMTPEFGPDGYLHHLPFTNVPVADLDSLNRWMARHEREHFMDFMG